MYHACKLPWVDAGSMRDVTHAQFHRGTLLLREIAEVWSVALLAVPIGIQRSQLLRQLPVKAQAACLLNMSTQPQFLDLMLSYTQPDLLAMTNSLSDCLCWPLATSSSAAAAHHKAQAAYLHKSKSELSFMTWTSSECTEERFCGANVL